MKEILLTSSILILVLAALRFLLRGKISLRLQYALWLLVAVRLLVPASLPGSGWSVLNAVSPGGADASVYVSSQGISTQAPAPEIQVGSDGQEMAVYYDSSDTPQYFPVGETPPANTGYRTVPASQVVDLDALLTKLWLLGAAAMGVWLCAVNLRLSRRAAKGARRLAVPDCPIPVYISASVPSPCLLGLVRQRIYVTPACGEDPVRLRHVLAHELTHRRHGDPWWSLVRAVCLCLYWFNPLVWWAAALSRRDCELACDEGAIRSLGEPERIAYGRTLVDMVAVGTSPGGLLQTATTMHSGKSGIRERIALLVKKPRMLAVTALCLLAVVSVTVGCTFTGPKSGDLGELLQNVPEEYADQVVLEVGENLPEDTLAAFYYAPDYGGDYGGWLFSVQAWDAVSFERHLCAVDTSGTACWVRSGEQYYAVSFPTDVRFDPSHSDDYAAVQDALMAWAEETVLSVDGMEPFTEDDVQALRNLPFQYEGNHITATYYPYYAVDGSRDVTWTFVLSQPATQGDGGVWCVEQIWYAGEFPQRQVVRPETDLTSAGYYAQLQSQADAGEADWALDPMEVCLRYAHSYASGHSGATADSFSLSDIYSSAPGSANAQATESLAAILGQGQVIVDLSYQSRPGSWFDRSLTFSAEDPAIQALMDQLTDDFSWVDTHWPWTLATDPWSEEDLSYMISIHTPAPETAVNTQISLLVYADSPYVQIASAQSVTGVPSCNYQVTPTAGTASLAETLRDWIDEARATAAQSPKATVEAAVDAIVAGESASLTLRADGGQSVGTCSGAPEESYNGIYTLQHLTSDSFFTWSEAEDAAPPEDPEVSLTVEAGDGSATLEFWQGSDLVRCTLGHERRMLRAESTGYDALSPDVFRHMRNWYDEMEWIALTRDIVIPDEGQDHLAVAQAWVDAVQNVHLQVPSGSKYAYTYVRNIVELWDDAPDDFYDDYMLETEHFYFSYHRIFVPENAYALNWSMAGNTGEYDGSYGEAPEGAMMNAQMGPMHLTAEGWRCDRTGTGP